MSTRSRPYAGRLGGDIVRKHCPDREALTGLATLLGYATAQEWHTSVVHIGERAAGLTRSATALGRRRGDGRCGIKGMQDLSSGAAGPERAPSSAWRHRLAWPWRHAAAVAAAALPDRAPARAARQARPTSASCWTGPGSPITLPSCTALPTASTRHMAST